MVADSSTCFHSKFTHKHIRTEASYVSAETGQHQDVALLSLQGNIFTAEIDDEGHNGVFCHRQIVFQIVIRNTWVPVCMQLCVCVRRSLTYVFILF